MNKIDLLLNNKSNILNIFFTAGFPNLESTTEILKNLELAGCDMVEIGIPFSDPLADGETIQKSSEKALGNGMSVDVLFKQLSGFRQWCNLPVVFMGYINPILQYGFDRFINHCIEVGIDGLIIPDLPIEIFLREFKPSLPAHAPHFIFLITPQTTTERVRIIEKNSGGFIYLVSTDGTTGQQNVSSANQNQYLERIKALNLALPTLVGFGISNNQGYQLACQYSNGAIVGSAFIKHISKNGTSIESITQFVDFIRKG